MKVLVVPSNKFTKEPTKINSDTFSSRAKQHARFKAVKKDKMNQSHSKSNSILKRNKKIVKDFTPKTPMNDMRGPKKLNNHNLQQSMRK